MGCGADKSSFTLNLNPTLPAIKIRPMPIRPVAGVGSKPDPTGLGRGEYPQVGLYLPPL